MKLSAGILLYRKRGKGVEVLLEHPGGPFWAKKDAGAWSIPKGELDEDEEPFTAAKREFAEELGSSVPDGDFIDLGKTKVSSSKIVHAWALEADFDADHIKSNPFTMEWPPKSGRQQEFPEVDRAAWFSLGAARTKLVKGQLPFLDTLTRQLGLSPNDAADAQESGPQQTQLL